MLNPCRDNGLAQRAGSPELQPLMERLRADVDWFGRNFRDDPTALSGWGHHYFCDEDGALLQYDRTSPEAHRCPQCGKVFTGRAYCEAWRYMYRYEAVQSAYEAAALYRVTGDARYGRHVETILGYYADHYDEFVPHGEASGLGRITPQMLDEAVFLVRAVCAIQLARPVLDPAFVQRVGWELLLPAARFVGPQKKIIHNISCWINACLMGVGLVCGKDDLVQDALYGPTGFAEQVRQGVTADRFWFEGSLHYNFYTIEALLHTMLFAEQYGAALPEDAKRIVYEMMLAPCRLAFRDMTLPNPNDGWPGIGLRTYSYLYELAAFLFADPVLADAAQRIRTAETPQAGLPMGGPLTQGAVPLEQLLYGTGVLPQDGGLFGGSCNFPASNYAMLRSDKVEVFLKYGHRSPSHAHPDKMNLEVHAFGRPVSTDPSNCGYAAPLCGAYYRRTHAHNTVELDGADHPTTDPGICESWEPGNLIQVRTPEAYPGVEFARQVCLTEDGFTDVFEVTGAEEHGTEWFFHVQGELCAPLAGEPAPDCARPGIFDPMRLPAGKVTLCWQMGPVRGYQNLWADGAEIVTARSAGTPGGPRRSVVMLRTRGKNACFRQEWRFERT